MTGKIKIEGINLSEKRVAVNFWNLPNTNETLIRFCRVLTEHQININFLSAGGDKEDGWIICCVAENDQDLLKRLIGLELGITTYVEVVPSIGLLTIFPHKNSFKFFGITLRAFLESELPLCGLTSSISAFSFVTEFNLFKKAVLKLQKFLKVRPDEIYYKEELNDWKEELQTSAVYLESRIKTYGFKEYLGLCLMELCLNRKNLTECSLIIEDLEEADIRFEQVSIQKKAGNCIRIYILFEKRWEERTVNAFETMVQKEILISLNIISPVGLICFYGPHFGDRYGIADAALISLKTEDIPIIVIGCSSSSIYLVFQEEMTDRAKRILEQEFEVPRHVKK
ncbi:hypothetical protein ACFL1Z_03560 [Thermodesulfobacteriota bacterium]